MNDPYRLAVDFMPGLVWSALPDGYIDFLNMRWLAYTGLTLDEARGWGWQAAVHPADLPNLLAVWETLLSGVVEGEVKTRLRRHDGVFRWFIFRAVPFCDEAGSVVKWYGETTDIDDLKYADALLAGEKYLLEMIANGTSLDLILNDMCLKIDEITPGSLSTIRLLDSNNESSSKIVGPNLPAAYATQVECGIGDQAQSPCAAVIQTGQAVIISDMAVETAWPSFRELALRFEFLSTFTSPILSSKNKVLGTLSLHSRARGAPNSRQQGIIDHFTHIAAVAIERKQVEAALEKSRRLEALGTLAGGIAHDFNNILGIILGYGEMALSNVRVDSRLRRDLEQIMHAGERGRSLTGRILTFSQSGVGERLAVNVEAVVCEAVNLLLPTVPSNVRIKTTFRASYAAMLGDPAQVHQVVMNLMTNAIQAMPEGGILHITLDIQKNAATHVAVTGLLNAGEYLVLQVEDSGSGIESAILDRIFDPFFTTKEVGVGTGLGLSLVHGIVTEVGGAIDVASTVGKGSKFTVYLPRAGDAEAFVNKALPPLPRGSGQRILIVDDEEPLVQLAAEILTELGYVPCGFSSSLLALDAFRAEPARFDALLTDERMPIMTGSALAAKVRLLRRSMPVVLMSGYLGNNTQTSEFDTLFDDFLRKPLTARELANSLSRVLSV